MKTFRIHIKPQKHWSKFSFRSTWNKTFEELADYKKGPFGSALKKEIFVPKSNTTYNVIVYSYSH